MTGSTKTCNSRLAIVAAILALATSVAAQELGDYAGARETEHPDWFKESFLDFEEDIEEATANGKRVMLYFWQRGCPYCAQLIEHNFTQKDIVDTTRANFDLIAINMWGDRDVVTVGGQRYTEKELAAALKVMYTPTLLFFDEAGKLALRIDGYYPPQSFRVALDYVAGHKEKEIGFRDYLASRQPVPASGSLNAQTFFMVAPFVMARHKAPAERPLAVFFEQKQCETCDQLHKKVLIDTATRDLMNFFDAVQLDMWSDTPVITPTGERITARDWAQALNIQYAPSVVFFDVNGAEVMRTEAFFKTFHFQSVLDYVLSESYAEQPSFQRYLQARADRLRSQGIDVDIFSY